MPFMKGRGAIRRTLKYLEDSRIVLKENVHVVAFSYNTGKRFPHHKGLENFVFWHLPQIQYKNPLTQIVTFKHITPSPYIQVFLANEEEVLVDCFNKSREEIYDHFRRVFGKSDEVLKQLELEQEAKKANPANFGYTFARQCICEVPGQIPCPGFCKLPEHMTGKYKMKVRSGEIDA